MTMWSEHKFILCCSNISFLRNNVHLVVSVSELHRWVAPRIRTVGGVGFDREKMTHVYLWVSVLVVNPDSPIQSDRMTDRQLLWTSFSRKNDTAHNVTCKTATQHVHVVASCSILPHSIGDWAQSYIVFMRSEHCRVLHCAGSLFSFHAVDFGNW